tara:strand:+ start:3715 stop:4725 length:1011 start_codon:yes stop_codon:yes gene_type:complete
MSRGIYQGADTMESKRAQSLWDVGQGKKRHDKQTLDQLGKRQLFGAVSDIGETFLPPGYKQLVDVSSKQLEQKLFEMPEYEEEGGQFWGSKFIAEYEEEDKALRSDLDTSLLESIIGTGSAYIGDKDRKDFGSGADVAEAGGLFSSEGLGTLLGFMKNGGRVPKYKEGGGLFKRFGKKKQPEKDEALVALDAILSGGYERKEGKHEYPMGYTVSQDYTTGDSGREIFRLISQLSTPEGDRYYPGEGESRSVSLGQTKARMDAASRAFHSPADSITTDQLAKFKELGLFEEGGQVPQYYGGGSVSEGSPTIAGYFNQQGKTLGGSNIESIGKKLGRT